VTLASAEDLLRILWSLSNVHVQDGPTKSHPWHTSGCSYLDSGKTDWHGATVYRTHPVACSEPPVLSH